MTLPASGAIDLNAIHIEAGGTTGTACNLDDQDIRGLIGETQTGQAHAFSDWYSAPYDWIPEPSEWDTGEIYEEDIHDILIAGSATVIVSVQANGVYGIKITSGWTYYNWHGGGVAPGSAYEIKWVGTGFSDPDTGLTENTWYDLGSTRQFAVEDTTWGTGGEHESQFTLTIRLDSDAASEHAQDFHIYAEWNQP